jgi:flagellar hook-associated protein 3 FlgL
MGNISTVSSLERSMSMRNSISKLTKQQTDAANEVATGFKTDVYADTGASAGKSNVYRAKMETTDAYINSNTLLSNKLDATELALTDVQSSAQSFLEELTGSGQTTDRADLQSQAQTYLDDIVNKLNTTYGGEYLFSGNATQTKPLDGTDANGNPVYVGDTVGTQSAMIDDNTTLEYGVRADDESITQIISALSAFANTDIVSMDDDTYNEFLNTQISTLGEGITGLTSTISGLGVQQSNLETKISTQESQYDLYQESIVDIEGVDESEASVILNSLTDQLEATYEVTAKISGMSLFDYL